MSVIHPIPYQGSKRKLAPRILGYFPQKVRTLYEPFAGSGAVTLAAAAGDRAERFILGESLPALATVWQMIIVDPQRLIEEYTQIWRGQGETPNAYFHQVRAEFNDEGGAARLLFLLTRCVKNTVRFNRQGQFNQSADKRRRGTRPERMAKHLMAANRLLEDRAECLVGDYSQLCAQAQPTDLVYLDPPYQGTSGQRDKRYHQTLDRPRFIRELEGLLARRVPFLVSFDGRTGERTYGPHLPEHLGLTRVELSAGLSSQSTLSGRTEETVESLYLSPHLTWAPPAD